MNWFERLHHDARVLLIFIWTFSFVGLLVGLIYVLSDSLNGTC